MSTASLDLRVGLGRKRETLFFTFIQHPKFNQRNNCSTIIKCLLQKSVSIEETFGHRSLTSADADMKAMKVEIRGI